MIGYLEGVVKTARNNEITVVVGGVGYVVQVGLQGFTRRQAVKLFVHSHVNDRSITLFGFMKEAELALFKDLLSVSGVGPKGAMTLVSQKGVSEVIEGIISGDHKLLKVPGLGKKILSKIILELQDSIDTQDYVVSKKGKGGQGSIKNEAKEALIALGYTELELSAALQHVTIVKDDKVETVVKKLLSILHK